MKRRVFCMVAVSSILAAAANGQQYKTAKSYVLQAARMFDGKSDALTTPGLVVVRDGKIAGLKANASVPEGGETIDPGDATQLARFIHAHTHVTMNYREDYTRA